MTTTLRQAITGTYDRDSLADLTRPVAWSGTVDADTRREQEADRAALVDEIRELLADSEIASVCVDHGEVVSLNSAAEATTNKRKPMHPVDRVALPVFLAWFAALAGAFGETGQSTALAAFFVAVAIAATIRGTAA